MDEVKKIINLNEYDGVVIENKYGEHQRYEFDEVYTITGTAELGRKKYILAKESYEEELK